MTPGSPPPDPAPTDRDPFIDLLRVAAVLLVVFGHWMTTSVFGDLDRIEGENALSVIGWFRIATWLLQVMPVLFFVGGFSNWRALAARDYDYLRYLRDRLHRLMRPSAVLFGVWIAVGVVLEIVEPGEGNFMVEAAEVAALPMWFLGIYILVVALAPAMLRLHESGRWSVPIVLTAGTAVVDVLHLGLGVPEIGVANYAFVWLLAHQLGFFYADGTLLRLSMAGKWVLAAGGLGSLVVLTTWLGYPVSLVGVPGQARWNTDPPALPLVAGTAFLLGLILLVRPLLRANIDRGLAAALVKLNPAVLTTYVWHVSALPLAVAVLYPRGFPRPTSGALRWWAWRPLWLAVLALALVGLVTVFRRFEAHPRQDTPSRGEDSTTTRLTVAGLAAFSLAVGVLGFGRAGFTDIGGAGSSLLSFTVNPLQSLLHLVVGFALLEATRGRGVGMRAAAAAAAAVYVGVGTLAWLTVSSVDALGMNAATGALHVVVGALAAVLLLGAYSRTRSDRGS